MVLMRGCSAPISSRAAIRVGGARHSFAAFRGLAALLILSSLFSGCADGRRRGERLRAADRLSKGIVYVLPGIEGYSAFNASIRDGLAEANVPYAIEIYDWTTGIPGDFVGNLTNYERNRRQARALASRISSYRARHPEGAVVLVGHSGGCGIAVLALESLPPDRPIDMAILLAPALSKDYDLTAALRRTRHGIWSFHSALDFGLMGAGTSVFGSIDRGRGASAGMIGFDEPADLSPEGRQLYPQRLRQVEWNDRLIKYGALGGHFTWTSREFSRNYLAPIILHGAPPDAAAPEGSSVALGGMSKRKPWPASQPAARQAGASQSSR